MPVHANSKINTWVNTYYPDFYVSITNKENWTYNNYAGNAPALTAWDVYFTNLMTQMNAWAAASGPSRTETASRSLISAIYSYLACHFTFGTSLTDVGVMAAHKIYNMNGFVDSTLSRPDDWYNDLDTSGIPTPTYESNRMDADISVISASPDTTETAAILTINSLSSASASSVNYSFLFEDPAPTGTMTKANQATYIFTTLRFKPVVQSVPGILGVTIPPGV